MAGSTKSIQLGTYVTMIVGLLFLFLVVSQAGKFRKDGAVVTSAKERAALLDERQKTLLKIGAMPVPGADNPLAGMPGATMQTTVGVPGQQNRATQPVRPSNTAAIRYGSEPDNAQSMQQSIQRLLDSARRDSTSTQQLPPRAERPAQPIAQTPQPTTQTPADAAPTTAKRQYVVRENDTLYGIALKVYGNGNLWRSLQQANPSINPNRLGQGMKLTIPEPDRPSAAYRRWSAGNEG